MSKKTFHILTFIYEKFDWIDFYFKFINSKQSQYANILITLKRINFKIYVEKLK